MIEFSRFRVKFYPPEKDDTEGCQLVELVH
ncbi:hypothetical protein VMF7928_02463 [Vibrio marisflavi CECT 7928]|uniref:Uncharacterized protein n=1 Tax=Vibrio marisflavi CECT 7928 TaxID=634439 RepID=A0ABM9A538_9VIBR|nr:hypothetical protein VMF7928_02463 [Vibrio marisflavi CECT 7928]